MGQFNRSSVINRKVHRRSHPPPIIVIHRRNHSDQWVEMSLVKGSDWYQFPADRGPGPMLSVWEVLIHLPFDW